MKLNELKPNPGAVTKAFSVGRGIGSGKGKTSGRGVKGQKARTGVALKGFQGGQMPLERRLPKVGFTNVGRIDYATVTLRRIQDALDAGKIDPKKPVDEQTLLNAGVVRRLREGVKVIGNAVLTAKLDLSVTHATKGAIAAIEKAGGKIAVARPDRADVPPPPKKLPKKKA